MCEHKGPCTHTHTQAPATCRTESQLSINTPAYVIRVPHKVRRLWPWGVSLSSLSLRFRPGLWVRRTARRNRPAERRADHRRAARGGPVLLHAGGRDVRKDHTRGKSQTAARQGFNIWKYTSAQFHSGTAEWGFHITFFTITVSVGEEKAAPNLETNGLCLSSSLSFSFSFSLSPFHEPWTHLQKKGGRAWSERNKEALSYSLHGRHTWRVVTIAHLPPLTHTVYCSAGACLSRPHIHHLHVGWMYITGAYLLYHTCNHSDCWVNTANRRWCRLHNRVFFPSWLGSTKLQKSKNQRPPRVASFWRAMARCPTALW